MINPEEESRFTNSKPPPIEYICASCRKRKQVGGDDGDFDESDTAHKRLKLEDDDDSSACLKRASAQECMENDKDDSMKDIDQLEPPDKSPLAESAEDELRRLRKEWSSPIYAFFKSSPEIRYVGTRRVHVFECLAGNCKAKGKNQRFVNRYLDKADARSTSNLRKHVKICWGADILAAADKNKDLDAIRAVVSGKTESRDGRPLAAAIEGLGKGKLTYILSIPDIS